MQPYRRKHAGHTRGREARFSVHSLVPRKPRSLTLIRVFVG